MSQRKMKSHKKRPSSPDFKYSGQTGFMEAYKALDWKKKKNQGRHLERRTRVMDARHLVMDGRSGHLDKGTREQRPRGKEPEHLRYLEETFLS